MCRLYGQRALPEADLELPLVSGHNALRHQSREHDDGWGIGWYENGAARLLRDDNPAHEDPAFVAAVRAARPALVVAHVRDASCGPVAPENTHPFQHGRWLFAHNGTVARFAKSDAVRDALEAEIDPDLRAQLEGETDSERCFLLFLSRLRATVGPGAEAELPDVRKAMAATVETVVRLADAGAERSSTLNFLVSDGRLLAACRHGKDLHALTGVAGRLLALSSEPVARWSWRRVAEGSFVGIDAALRIVQEPLGLPHRRSAVA
jgi:predicted glutamine amidotransferase